MSTYSLDSLEKESNTRDNESNESSFVAISSIRNRNLVKFCGNAIIASRIDMTQEFSSRMEKLPQTTLGMRTHFRTGRSVAKKFNVPRRSLSSSSSSEFRHGTSSLTRKRTDDVTGFMKADKKPGNVQHDVVVDKHKKPVSYLELYRRKFGFEKCKCIETPVGSPCSICDDRSEERLVEKVNENVASCTVSRDKSSHVAYRRRVLQLESPRKSLETCSCDGVDSFSTNETAGRDEKRADIFAGSLDRDIRSINRRERVSYKPYNIEDYKSLSVPRADRSLGPDRDQLESKVEWLMRRRTYGDSVSALNRQRIARRAERLKHSRRADSQILPLYSTSTDLKHPGPASKIDIIAKQNEETVPATSVSRPKARASIKQKKTNRKTNSKKESSTDVLEEEKSSVSSKPKTKIRSLSRDVNDFYENSCDDYDDDGSMHLKNLRLRHLEEKRALERVFKRELCA